MFRWKKSYFCRSVVKVLVFLMVMHGLPLWELGQSYEWVPRFNISTRAKSGKVQLTWTHQGGTERYDVYRAEEADPFSFEKIGETTSTYSTYLDDTVLNETT